MKVLLLLGALVHLFLFDARLLLGVKFTADLGALLIRPSLFVFHGVKVSDAAICLPEDWDKLIELSLFVVHCFDYFVDGRLLHVVEVKLICVDFDHFFDKVSCVFELHI